MSGLISDKSKLKRYLTAGAVCAGIGALTLILSALIVYSMKDPDKNIRAFALGSLYISSVISGIVAARMTDGRIISSVIIGCVMTLLLTLVDITLYKPTTDVGTSLLLHLAIIGAYSLGGIIGRRNGNSSVKRRRVHRRRRR